METVVKEIEFKKKKIYKKKNNHLYMVMRLEQTFNLGLIGGSTIETKIGNCAGYIPVFKTLKQAQKSAGEKYKIHVIESL